MGFDNFINWLNENDGLIQSVEMVAVSVLGAISLFLRRRETKRVDSNPAGTPPRSPLG